MLENLLVIILVVLAIIMIAVILLQPDRSQGLAKNANIVDEEKEGIEKFYWMDSNSISSCSSTVSDNKIIKNSQLGFIKFFLGI